MSKRSTRSLNRKRSRRFIIGCNVAGPDAGSFDDPFVARIDDLADILVTEAFPRQG
jgi:hypothetical protein